MPEVLSQHDTVGVSEQYNGHYTGFIHYTIKIQFSDRI